MLKLLLNYHKMFAASFKPICLNVFSPRSSCTRSIATSVRECGYPDVGMIHPGHQVQSPPQPYNTKTYVPVGENKLLRLPHPTTQPRDPEDSQTFGETHSHPTTKRERTGSGNHHIRVDSSLPVLCRHPSDRARYCRWCPAVSRRQTE